jgi:hypothetical protein
MKKITKNQNQQLESDDIQISPAPITATSISNHTWVTGTINVKSTKYETIEILGRKFDIVFSTDYHTRLALSLIDFNGIGLYASMKKMNLDFNTEIGEFLDAKLKTYNRGQKIKKLLKKNDIT